MDTNDALTLWVKENKKRSDENRILKEAAKILANSRETSRQVRMNTSRLEGKKLFATVSVKFELR